MLEVNSIESISSINIANAFMSKKFCFMTCSASKIVMKATLHHVETSQLVNTTNQWTGSYMMERSGSTQLMLFIILMFYLNAISLTHVETKKLIFSANSLLGF